MKAKIFEAKTPVSRDEAKMLSKSIKQKGGEIEKRLAAKCVRECMSRVAVICCWGDPHNW